MPGEQTPPVAPELSAHDAAMVAKADAVATKAITDSTPQPLVDTPPATTATPAETAEATPPVTQEDLAKAPEGEAEKAVEAAGLDMSKLHAEFAEKGTLSEDSLKALEGAGYPRELVALHIEGVKAIQAQVTQAAYEVAGGADKYKAMATWAAAALSAEDQAAFDKAVTGSDSASRKQAIVALRAQYEQAFGTNPQLVQGGGQGDPGITPFASQAEVSEAMRNPKYKSDPAYRDELYKRLAVSPQF